MPDLRLPWFTSLGEDPLFGGPVAVTLFVLEIFFREIGHSGRQLGGKESEVGMENLPIRRKFFVLPSSSTSISLFNFPR